MDWTELERLCYDCRRCVLAAGRQNVVIGDGSRQAKIMLIGEGPGRQEDEQGRPFVGAAGQLLDKMLASIGLNRELVYIANIVKCRPPGNRDPEPEEREACLPLLRWQVSLIRPRIIVCLGRIAAQVIIRPDFRITREHGVWSESKGVDLIATYHPSALLRDPEKKRDAYADLLKIQSRIQELQLLPADSGD